VIWWPGRGTWTRSLVVDFRRQWKRVNWDLHSAIGFWTVLFISMWAVTGVYFVFPASFRTVVDRMSPLTQAHTPQSDPAGATQSTKPGWRELIDEAKRRVPGQHIARVVPPFSDTSPFLVMFSRVRPTPSGGAELTSVYLDQYTGTVLSEPPQAPRSVGDIVMAWVAPLHVGNFAGNGIRVAWLIFGLAPPLLFATGFMMWWTRVVRVRWLRFATSYPPGPEE